MGTREWFRRSGKLDISVFVARTPSSDGGSKTLSLLSCSAVRRQSFVSCREVHSKSRLAAVYAWTRRRYFPASRVYPCRSCQNQTEMRGAMTSLRKKLLKVFDASALGFEFYLSNRIRIADRGNAVRQDSFLRLGIDAH